MTDKMKESVTRWTGGVRLDSVFKKHLNICEGASMPLLQVREYPEGIYKEFKLAAKSENRSIAQ